MKNFMKVLSKTFKKGLSKRFETFSKVEGYAKHTPTLRKARCRFCAIPLYVIPLYVIPLYVIKGRNPL